MEIKMIKTGLLEENTYVVSNSDKFCLIIDPGWDLNKINEYIKFLAQKNTTYAYCVSQ